MRQIALRSLYQVTCAGSTPGRANLPDANHTNKIDPSYLVVMWSDTIGRWVRVIGLDALWGGSRHWFTLEPWRALKKLVLQQFGMSNTM